jgi:hypothetical protein
LKGEDQLYGMRHRRRSGVQGYAQLTMIVQALQMMRMDVPDLSSAQERN